MAKKPQRPPPLEDDASATDTIAVLSEPRGDVVPTYFMGSFPASTRPDTMLVSGRTAGFRRGRIWA
jgi:hypothetical protein